MLIFPLIYFVFTNTSERVGQREKLSKNNQVNNCNARIFSRNQDKSMFSTKAYPLPCKKNKITSQRDTSPGDSSSNREPLSSSAEGDEEDKIAALQALEDRLNAQGMQFGIRDSIIRNLNPSHTVQGGRRRTKASDQLRHEQQIKH